MQLVNLRLTALGRLPDLMLAQRADRRKRAQRERDVWFAETGFVRDAGALARRAGAGTRLHGPGDHRGDGFHDGRAAGLAGADRRIWLHQYHEMKRRFTTKTRKNTRIRVPRTLCAFVVHSSARARTMPRQPTPPASKW